MACTYVKVLPSLYLILVMNPFAMCIYLDQAPFKCPEYCICEKNSIRSCSMNSLKQVAVTRRLVYIEELRIDVCDERNFNYLKSIMLTKISKMRCDVLIVRRNATYSRCLSFSTQDNHCSKICTKAPPNGALETKSSLICSNRQPLPSSATSVAMNRLTRSEQLASITFNYSNINYISNNDTFSHLSMSVSMTSSAPAALPFLLNFASKIVNCCLNKTSLSLRTLKKPITRNANFVFCRINPELFAQANKYYHLIYFGVICSLSVIGLLINAVAMVMLCRREKLTVADIFSSSLMLFNILMSFYGVAMALYSLHLSPSSTFFCELFISIKLFSLGAGVYTLICLSFHRVIRKSKEDERNCIFKAIVYVLEGATLSGVFAVTSWVKLGNWNYLCAILTAKSADDWPVIFIEGWYYLCALALVIFQVIRFCWRRKANSLSRLLIEHQVDAVERKAISKEESTFILMSTSSLLIWTVPYIATIPEFDIFNFELSAVIRVCALMLATILQPLIYMMPSRYCCACLLSVSQMTGDVALKCECNGFKTCKKCCIELNEFGTNFTLPLWPVGQHVNEKELENKPEMNGKETSFGIQGIINSAAENGIDILIMKDNYRNLLRNPSLDVNDL